MGGIVEREVLKIVRNNQGLYYWGTISSVISPTQFTSVDLATFGDGFFFDFYIIVLKKADGTVTPPKSEGSPVAAYVSTGGIFTHNAFTAPLAVGDEIVVLLGIGFSDLEYIFSELSSVPINTTATNAGETDILLCPPLGPDVHYIVRNLRVKCVDPGANTVTVRLYELINNILSVVDTFAITTLNYTVYFNLMDMFGLPSLAGDSLRITVRASAGGPYTVTGQYAWARTG